MQISGELAQIGIRRLPLRDHAAQVAAEAEILAGAREHHRAHRALRPQVMAAASRSMADLQVQRVRHVRPIERDHGDGAAGFDFDGSGADMCVRFRISYSSGAMVTRSPASAGVNSIWHERRDCS